jgi:hypothetical protein
MMDLTRLLTSEVLLLKKEEIGSIIGPSREKYDELFQIAFSRNMPVCWRSAWILDYLAELHPWLAGKYIAKIWAEIPEGHPDGVTRSCLRLLCRYDIPEDYQGIAADLCLSWLEREAVPVAIKAYSMELLLKIVRLYPELANEFIAVIEDQAPNNSAGFKARAVYVIGEMQKLGKL